ncbi:hypothetical protein GS421_01415 [Rhodococcus hoagii]|nr:hypothetical protein [Prescottella equi]
MPARACPTTAATRRRRCSTSTRVGFYSMRPLCADDPLGVFERFPKLKFAVSEQGCAWAPDLMRQLDTVDLRVKRTGRIGELFYSEDEHFAVASERVLPAKRVGRCHDAVGAGHGHARHPRRGQVHVGQRLPAHEGTYPFHARVHPSGHARR